MRTAVQIGRVVLLLSAAMLAVTTAAGCARDASAKATHETPAVIKPQEITINSKNYFFVAPDTIESGLTTIHLRNSGPALHHAQIIKLPEGKTVDDLLNETKQKGEAAFAQVGLFGGPNAPTPGGEATVTVDLQPGNYALICFIPTAEGVPHLMKGMTRALTVVPSKHAAATPPVADASLVLTDYKFDFSIELKSGERTIKVENKATQPHEVFMAKLNDGTTAEQFLKALETMGPNMPGVAYGGTVGLQPGAINYMTTRLTPGKYALFCFVSDAKDGKPHVAHGMFREFTVN
jgi:hypothetical protein